MNIHNLYRRLKMSYELAKLTADPLSCIKLIISFNSRPLWRRFGRSDLVHAQIRINIKSQAFPINFYNNFEYNQLHQIIAHELYNLHFIKKAPNIIVDLGSSSGLSVLYFRALFPHALIHAVEADPWIFKRLQKNTIGIPGIQLHNFAIAKEKGFVKFYRSTHRPHSSSLYGKPDTEESIVVPSMNLDAFLQNIGEPTIDLLKFNIEGAEAYIFMVENDILEHIHHFIGEVHLDLIGCSKKAFLSHLQGFELDLRNLSPQRFIVEGIKKT